MARRINGLQPHRAHAKVRSCSPGRAELSIRMILRSRRRPRSPACVRAPAVTSHASLPSSRTPCRTTVPPRLIGSPARPSPTHLGGPSPLDAPLPPVPVTRRHRDTHVRAEQRRFRRARDGQAWQAPELPRFYYHDHFARFLRRGPRRARAPICSAPPSSTFLDGFDGAGLQRALHLRSARQPPGLRVRPRQARLPRDRGDPHGGVGGARATRGSPSRSRPRSRPDWLDRLTRPELVALLEATLCATRFRKSWKKAELVRAALEKVDTGGDARAGALRRPGRAASELNYLLYLYFGRIDDNLQAFTLHGPRPRRAARTRATDPARRFDSPEEARSGVLLRARRARPSPRRGRRRGPHWLADTRADWPDTGVRGERRASAIGCCGELGVAGRAARGRSPSALALYDGLRDAPRCNERTVRLRHRRDEGDDRAWVRARLEAMIDDPASDEEAGLRGGLPREKVRRRSARRPRPTSCARPRPITVDEAWRGTARARGARALRGAGHRRVPHRKRAVADPVRRSCSGRSSSARKRVRARARHSRAARRAHSPAAHADGDREEARRPSMRRATALALLLERLSVTAPTRTSPRTTRSCAVSATACSSRSARTPRCTRPREAVAHVLRLMAGATGETRATASRISCWSRPDACASSRSRPTGDALRQKPDSRACVQLRVSGFRGRARARRLRRRSEPDLRGRGRRDHGSDSPGYTASPRSPRCKVRGGEGRRRVPDPREPAPRHCPPKIARLTGITDEMVAHAPDVRRRSPTDFDDVRRRRGLRRPQRQLRLRLRVGRVRDDRPRVPAPEAVHVRVDAKVLPGAGVVLAQAVVRGLRGGAGDAPPRAVRCEGGGGTVAASDS